MAACTSAPCTLLVVLLLLTATAVLGHGPRETHQSRHPHSAVPNTHSATQADSSRSTSASLEPLAMASAPNACASAPNGLSFVCNATCGGNMESLNVQSCNFCLVDRLLQEPLPLTGLFAVVNSTAITVDLYYESTSLLATTASGSPPVLRASIAGTFEGGANLNLNVAAANLSRSGNFMTGFSSGGSISVGFDIWRLNNNGTTNTTTLAMQSIATYSRNDSCHGYAIIIAAGCLILLLALMCTWICYRCCSKPSNPSEVVETLMSPIVPDYGKPTTFKQAQCPACNKVLTIQPGAIVGSVMACGGCSTQFSVP